MTKTFCDRCGVEIVFVEEEMGEVNFWKNRLAKVTCNDENKCLCHLCFEGLKEYLKPKE